MQYQTVIGKIIEKIIEKKPKIPERPVKRMFERSGLSGSSFRTSFRPSFRTLPKTYSKLFYDKSLQPRLNMPSFRTPRINSRAQVMMEYILIIGFAFAIIIPSIYFFYSYSEDSAASLSKTQYTKLGQEIIATAVETLAQGKGSWTILDTLVPQTVQNITTSIDGKELVITFETPNGPSDAVFFSDEANLSGAGIGGSLYASRVHGGRLTLQFFAGSNGVVQMGEVIGSWIAPQCSSDDDCYSYAAENFCFYEGSCSEAVCSYTSEDKNTLPQCTGDWELVGSNNARQCSFNPPAPHTCTNTGWECPESWRTDPCPVRGVYNENQCWYKPAGISDECNATGCQLAIDTNKECAASICNINAGWDNSACTACVDADGDGYNITGGSCGPVDCDDTNASIHPGAVEECSDKVDDDCDNNIDELDADCAVSLALQPNVTAPNALVIANLTSLDGLLFHDSVDVLLCPAACHFCQSGMTAETCTFQAPPDSGTSSESAWLSCSFTAPESAGVYTYRACLWENQASATLNTTCMPYYDYYDYNDDSLLDTADTLILKGVTNGDACPPSKSCDVNHDGVVDSYDIDRLYDIIAGGYDDGEVCTDGIDNNCDGLLDNADPSCATCGGNGQDCCPPSKTCDAGLTCCAGTCMTKCG